MLAGSAESWFLDYTVEFWKFLLTSTHAQGVIPTMDLSPNFYLPWAIRCLRLTPGWTGGLVGVTLSTFWPRVDKI